MEPEVSDVSNKTIVVLVVLTVIISVLSTLVVMNEVQNTNFGATQKAVGKNPGTSIGQVSFEVVGK